MPDDEDKGQFSDDLSFTANSLCIQLRVWHESLSTSMQGRELFSHGSGQEHDSLNERNGMISCFQVVLQKKDDEEEKFLIIPWYPFTYAYRRRSGFQISKKLLKNIFENLEHGF